MKKYALLFIIFVLFHGCTKTEDTPDSTVLKHVVIQYNKLLSEGYRNLNMTNLLDVATQERAQKAYYHMSALGEAGKKMDAKVESVSFLDIRKTDEHTATLKTREKWNYTHIDIDTGDVLSQSRIVYELTYTLSRQDEKWLVSDIRIDSEEEINADP